MKINIFIAGVIGIIVQDVYGYTEKTFKNKSTVTVVSELCERNHQIIGTYELGRPDNKYQYNVTFNRRFYWGSMLWLKLDDNATVELTIDTSDKWPMSKDNLFLIPLFGRYDGVTFTVRSLKEGKLPYIQFFNLFDRPQCWNPMKGVFDKYLESYNDFPAIPCGRQQIDYMGLIVNGAVSKPGEWPWHVAIYKLGVYICGGTLISEKFVVTAAHCVTVGGRKLSAENFRLRLGRNDLLSADARLQEKEVEEIIVHENFKEKLLKNDIALLRLSADTTFDDHVQPACLWTYQTDRLLPTNSSIYGTVAGWGLDATGTFSSQLKHIVLPKLDDIVCIRQNTLFYATVLDGNKFCAGYQNGTSPCNGDSGGGFVVFVPGTRNSPIDGTGLWYLRGIVSMSMVKKNTLNCDPEQNSVYTDTARYESWIKRNIRESNAL